MEYLIMTGSAFFAYFYFQYCVYEHLAGKDERNVRNCFLQEIIPNKKGKIIMLAVSFGAAFLLTRIFLAYGYFVTKILKYLLLIGGLMPIAWVDGQEKKIPNLWLVYLLCIRAAVFGIEALFYPDAFVDNLIFTLIGGAVSGLVMFTGYVISRHQIGAGDIKLFIVIGMYLGARLNYFVMTASLMIAAVYGVVKVLLKRSGIKDEIAFAPFITASVILLLVLGF